VKISGVLFDLDGTLVDTAPDMGGALNDLRVQHAREPLAAAQIRPWVSHGGAALVRLGFGDVPEERFEPLRLQFLELYSRRLSRESFVFAGGAAMLDALDAHGVPWGIVTNKPGWLTTPLLAALGLAQRAASVVSGDTLANKKPHPEPLLFAAAQIGLPANEFAFIGDAERDMLAAQAAGMVGVAATFGYIAASDRVEQWPQAASIDSLAALLPWLRANGLQGRDPHRPAAQAHGLKP
jgi:N-acetyl-D-muramate 6-phosphate phosphatase